VPIEKPDTDKDVRFPIHPGTAAYLDDTDISWFTLFSDQIWTVWLVGGVLASASIGFLGFMRTPSKDPTQGLLERLGAITARAKTHPDELDRLTDELAEVASKLATLAYEGKVTADQFAPVQLAYDNARFAVETARDRQARRAS